MKRIRNSKGFTLIELMIVLAIICILVVGFGLGLIGGVAMGNGWFFENDVLRKIQLNHPQASKIIDTERNIWRYSVITVEESGQKKQYGLDSNVLFNYKILDYGDK